MPGQRKVITLSIQDDFSRQLKSFVQQIDAAERGVKDFERATAGGGGGGFFRQGAQDLFYMANAAQAVYSAFSGVFQTADQWAQIGVGAARSKMALEQLVGGAQEAEKWMRAIQDATLGAMTGGEAASTAYQLKRLGFADTAEDAQRFYDTVNKITLLNPALGDVNQTMSQIQLTIANMSFMRLDQLGISVTDVKRRIKELQAETAGMSREQAFQIAVMAELEEQASLVTDEMLGMTDAGGRMKAHWRGFKEWIGLEISEGFEGAYTAAESFYKILTYLSDHPWEITLALTVTGEEVQRSIRVSATETAIDLALLSRDLREDFNVFVVGAALGALHTAGIVPKSVVPGAQEDMFADTYGFIEQQTRMATAPLNPITGLPWGPAFSREYDELRVASGLSNIVPADWWATMQGMPMERQRLWASPVGMELAGAYWGADQGDYDLFSRRRRTMFDERFAGSAKNRRLLAGLGADDMGMGMAVDTSGLDRLFASAKNVVGDFASIAGSVFKIGEGAQRIGDFTLEDAWGLDPTRIDLSIYDKMVGALRDANIEGEKSDAVMRAFALSTGMSNAQSEIFTLRLQDLTQQLEDGTITAEDYALAVGEIARQDYSWVDKMLGVPDSADRMERYYEIINKIANLPTTWGEDLGKVPDQIGQVMLQDKTGQAGRRRTDQMMVSPLTPMLLDMDKLTEKFGTIEADWGKPVELFSTGATTQFQTFQSEAETSMTEVQTMLDETFGKQYKLDIDVTASLDSKKLLKLLLEGLRIRES